MVLEASEEFFSKVAHLSSNLNKSPILKSVGSALSPPVQGACGLDKSRIRGPAERIKADFILGIQLPNTSWQGSS